jgi:hypothetical protein
VVCVYHSHVGCGAWFSSSISSSPSSRTFPFPDASHLVVSVIGGKVIDQALFERTDSHPGAGFVGRAVVNGRW